MRMKLDFMSCHTSFTAQKGDLIIDQSESHMFFSMQKPQSAQNNFFQNMLLNAIKTSIYWQNESLPAGPARLFSVLQILQL